MAREFLGQGWSYPVETDHRGNIALESQVENIRRSVRIILNTAKGERVMRPDFGCDIHDHVFSTLSPGTLNRIEDGVERALVKWEPRINVEGVEAEPDPSQPNRVNIEIDYWIMSTNSSDNMVFPFYLDEEQQ